FFFSSRRRHTRFSRDWSSDVCSSDLKDGRVSAPFSNFQARVRFLAYHRIKPHAPPLVRAPVNSFEFHPCGRTPQVDDLTLSLGHRHSIAGIESSSFRAWTTRVSNPVRSPRLRASASISPWYAAFAIGVLWHIYAFHRYLPHSAYLIRIQARQYQRHCDGRSEEHTSELQSRENLVCRLLLEKKKKKKSRT